jgi:long-chain acyl-CoA synthetase
MSIETLANLFLVTADHHKPDHLLVKESGPENQGQYRPISTGELVDRVRRIARALERWGVGRGDRVVLMADNGPHWPVVDFAALCRGAATVPVYPTLLPEQAAYVIADSGAKVAFVHRREMLADLLARRGEMPAVERFVLIEGGAGTAEEGDEDGEVTAFAAALEAGADADPDRFEAAARAVEAGDLASLVYTSGTTGKPKGTMLTHRNFVSNVCTALTLLDLRGDQTALSFLPLSHVFERMVNYCYFYRGLTVAYAESVGAVAQNLQEVRPHVFVSVPRVYEKVLAKVREQAAASPIKQRIFAWAEKVARRALPYRLRQDHPSGLLGLQLAIADGLVFSKIKERLGGRFEFAVSGGAPLGRDVAEFFWGAGIPIYEGYGLTETSPVIAVNTPGAIRLGTVGKPINGVEVRIAEDGEILVRGPNVMKGYWNDPEATAEAIDDEGWLHTGDIGELDEDGFLRITDRKKEIIVNAYGKNIAPAPIEGRLKSSRFVGHAVLIGDRRKYLAALLVPDFEALEAWAQQQGIDAADRAALVERPEVRELFDREVRAVNEKLAHYEQIVAWTVLPEDFSVETGELTPTQKVKRRVIDDKYGDRIEALYEEPQPERGDRAAGRG